MSGPPRLQEVFLPEVTPAETPTHLPSAEALSRVSVVLDLVPQKSDETYMEFKTLSHWGLRPGRPRKFDPLELFSFVQGIICGSCFYYHGVHWAECISHES